MRSAIAALSIGIYKVVQPGLDQLAEVEGKGLVCPLGARQASIGG